MNLTMGQVRPDEQSNFRLLASCCRVHEISESAVRDSLSSQRPPRAEGQAFAAPKPLRPRRRDAGCGV